MKHLHHRQQKLLEYLLDKPNGVTADELCDAAEVTKTAVKDHLGQLERFGYISFRDQGMGVGRPKRFYFLSPHGVEAFPRQYAWLSNALLEELTHNVSPEQLTKILRVVAEKTAAPLLEKLESQSKKERLASIVKVMNDLGYRAQLKEVGSAKGSIIEASNCVYHTTAVRYPQLCQFDIKFLEKTSAMRVQLQNCIARGGTSCRFCLK